MQITIKDTKLAGVKLVVTDRFEDYRGELGGVCILEHPANSMQNVMERMSFNYD